MSTTRDLVLASGNAGKLRELEALLAPLGYRVRSQAEFAVSEAAEPHGTFIENALAKARWAAQHTGLPALADDSGIVVPSLGGAPGVRSARYAATSPDARPADAANNALLLESLARQTDRRAMFVCVLALVRGADDPLPLIAQGVWAGQVLTAPRGSGGFGYDPLFQPDGMSCSAAELSAQDKNRMSHRGLAMRTLREQLTATPWTL
ncbi:RdgB/HAM1 family non-canonical purine NTP pyrophosphatase [Piscinibacterium candidicorallinum]|uniref:dITP/XTP pyrophosphatase n=1 Tax=Piscinibacterium candidicorallinum TaxID=1793872 RepID=A0ABV7H487_9BURK